MKRGCGSNMGSTSKKKPRREFLVHLLRTNDNDRWYEKYEGADRPTLCWRRYRDKKDVTVWRAYGWNEKREELSKVTCRACLLDYWRYTDVYYSQDSLWD